MCYYTKLTPTNKRPPLVYYCILHSVLCRPRVVGRSENSEEQVKTIQNKKVPAVIATLLFTIFYVNSFFSRLMYESNSRR